MSDDPGAPRRARDLAAGLADELRRAVAALSERELDETQLGEAARLARSLRERLERGARRPRWYDAEDAGSRSPASRVAYLDQSPIRGRLNPIAPPLAVELAERGDGTRVVRGRAELSRAYEGPPHGVHGGWVAALFDDLLGATQGGTGASGVTASLTVRYRHVTPVEEELRLEAWVARESGRRLLARATCHAGETLTAEAEGLFVRVDFDDVERRMQERRSGRGP